MDLGYVSVTVIVEPGTHPVVPNANSPCGKFIFPGVDAVGAVGGIGVEPGGAPMSCGDTKLQVGPPPLNDAVMAPLPVADGPLNALNCGVTLAGEEAGPVPTTLVAVTEQLYVVPLPSPVTMIGDAEAEALKAPQVVV